MTPRIDCEYSKIDAGQSANHSFEGNLYELRSVANFFKNRKGSNVEIFS